MSEQGGVFVKKLSPNFSEIIPPCGHTKTLLNRYIMKGNITPCPICYEQIVIQLFDDYNLNYLAKVKYGDVKSSSEFRLGTCKSCGHFIFAQPNRLSTKPKYCSNCYRLSVETICNDNHCKLINKVNKDSVSVQCNYCKSVGEIQLSNLYRHGYSCKSCNEVIKESNVYAFKINNQGYDYIKIGKSNSPYLRSLSFVEDSSFTSIEFICSTSTGNESEAYRFERYLKTKFKEFNIRKEVGKGIVDSGFTELYSTDILPELVTSIEFYEECCFD